MDVGVVVFDLVFDRSNLQGQTRPLPLPLPQQPLYGFIVIVGSKGHLGEVRVAELSQPSHSRRVSFRPADKRHQVRKPLRHQPSPRLLVVVQCEAKQPELLETVRHQVFPEFFAP